MAGSPFSFRQKILDTLIFQKDILKDFTMFYNGRTGEVTIGSD